ncbi:MAG TPA: hypothetical protein PLE48_06670 [Thiobacillus sp.]|nr:hypothetical protein [Thiobacillus sp.]
MQAQYVIRVVEPEVEQRQPQVCLDSTQVLAGRRHDAQADRHPGRVRYAVGVEQTQRFVQRQQDFDGARHQTVKQVAAGQQQTAFGQQDFDPRGSDSGAPAARPEGPAVIAAEQRGGMRFMTFSEMIVERFRRDA